MSFRAMGKQPEPSLPGACQVNKVLACAVLLSPASDEGSKSGYPGQDSPCCVSIL